MSGLVSGSCLPSRTCWRQTQVNRNGHAIPDNEIEARIGNMIVLSYAPHLTLGRSRTCRFIAARQPRHLLHGQGQPVESVHRLQFVESGGETQKAPVAKDFDNTGAQCARVLQQTALHRFPRLKDAFPTWAR